MRAATGASEGPGADREQRALDQLGHRHDAAGGGRRQQLAAEALLLEAGGDLRQVVLHQRLQRGVDRGAGGAAVLAHDRVDPVRERVGHAGQLLLDHLPQRQLVRRVRGRPEQAHGDRAELEAPGVGELAARVLLVQRGRDRAVGVDALLDLERVTARHVGVGEGAGVVVGTQRAALAPGEDVGEALGAEEGGAGRGPLEDRVGRLGRAEDEERRAGEQPLDRLAELLGGALERRVQAGEEALGLGQGLGDDQLAGLVADHDVGEGAADVAGDPRRLWRAHEGDPAA